MSSEEQKQVDGAPLQSGDSAMNATASPGGEAARGMSSSRRRLLIRGLVGGPVTLAAMRPVKSFAAKKYCHYSGWASFKVNPNSSVALKNKKKQKCSTGKKYSRYQNGHGWPTYVNNCYGQKTYLYPSGWSATQHKNLFGGSDYTTCSQYLSGNSVQSSFICAVFNAQQVSGYPFTVAQVYDIWQNPTILGPGVTQSLAALFFQQLNVS